MPKVDIIDYKTKDSNLIFLFVLAIVNKNRTANNINIFKKLNIN